MSSSPIDRPHTRLVPAAMAAAAAAFLLGACVPLQRTAAPAPPLAARVTAERLLADGLQAYEDGQYSVAQRKLRDALEEGLAARPDRIDAHKHLAFIYCVSRQEALCRDAFGRALQLDPAFTLTPAEAGHPLWGPVFRSLKPRGPS